MADALRAAVTARAGGCCEYCRSQERFSPQTFALEHVEPASRAGAAHPDNLALACQGCNNHKYTKTAAPDPATGAEAGLFHPRRQRWRDHFVWNDDCSEVLGVTPTGRATVAALRLNRPGVVNLRRVLFAAGLHPPAEG